MLNPNQRVEVQILNENYLSHHGIKGMKWGVRRYQNKDGSLTLSGKKRALKIQDQYTTMSNDRKYRDKNGNLTYAGRKKALKMQDKYSKVTGGKQLRKFPSKETPKTKTSIKEMSTDELRKKTERLVAEKNYLEAKQSLSSLKPKHVSKGKAFASKVGNEILAPAAMDLGKQLAKSMMAKTVNKAFKLDDDFKVYANNKKKQEKDDLWHYQTQPPQNIMACLEML